MPFFSPPSLLLSLAVAVAAGPVLRLRTLPHLGQEIPAAILRAHSAGRTCDAGDHHHDPCADVRVQHDRVTIAWDATTRKVTYLYSTTLFTDSELAVQGTGQIDPSIPLVPFHTGFISAEWCDTDRELSGDTLWCAVMKPDSAPRYGKVIGFVQSVYLLLPDIDSQPLHVGELSLPAAVRRLDVPSEAE